MIKMYSNQLLCPNGAPSKCVPVLVAFVVTIELLLNYARAADTVALAPKAILENSETAEVHTEQALGKLEYGVHYVFTPDIKEGVINVELHLSKAELVKSISFRHDKQRHSNFSGDGKLKRFKSSIRWEPGTGGDDAAVLRYQAMVSH